MGRYRWRTNLRTVLPYPVAMWIRKGSASCGDHEWYRSEADHWRCYHCEVGSAFGAERPERVEA